MEPQAFGSNWTEQKLNALRRYLIAYRKIFTSNEKAKFFRTTYVDAFAGSGVRLDPGAQQTNFDPQTSLLDEAESLADDGFRKGSVQISLELPEPFDRYHFIEKNPQYAETLQTTIRTKFSALEQKCTVRNGDAGQELMRFVETFDVAKERAVVFLDPYGMSVDWEVLQKLGETKAIDLWLLFPVGQGVNRMLTNGRLPDEFWCKRLDRVFGTPAWRTRFYSSEPSLFSEFEDDYVKLATYESINEFMIERLSTAFAGVTKKPLLLKNSKGVPLYSLCFAVANPNQSVVRTALRIADWVSEH